MSQWYFGLTQQSNTPLSRVSELVRNLYRRGKRATGIEKVSQMISSSKLFQSNKNKKPSIIYTYLQWSQNVCLVIVVLFGVFMIIRAIKKYKEEQFIKRCKGQYERLLKEKLLEEDLKFDLFKNILKFKNNDEGVKRRKINPDKILIDSDSIEGESTYH